MHHVLRGVLGFDYLFLVAIQPRPMAKHPSSGDIIEYIYTDSQSQNPINRAVTAGDWDSNPRLNYDREKYKEKLLDGTEIYSASSALIELSLANRRTKGVDDVEKEQNE